MTVKEREKAFAALGMKPFVSKQVHEWLYTHNVAEFSKMTNISKGNRELLDEHFTILPFSKIDAYPDSDGMATKYVVEVAPHKFVECVALKEKKYETLCVSSQSGCALACQFCLTGYAGFQFNLEFDFILAQLLLARSRGHNITHLVFMGMGEPLMNYDNVFKAIDIITSPDGFNISKRKITVSTSGYLAGIKRMVKDKVMINLAFSVGNANPVKRVEIMPVEKRNPLPEVIKALEAYQAQHNRKLTLEYTLLLDVNDQEEDLQSLARLAYRLDAKVNLINLNPHPKIPYTPVSRNTMRHFRDGLAEKNVRATIRYTKGQEVVAACGQLGESIIKDQGTD